MPNDSLIQTSQEFIAEPKAENHLEEQSDEIQ
jgi:hypothetical protein